MSRENKFRAWYPLNKEMVYPKMGQNFGLGGYREWEILRDFSPENIMQFTGLKDKNGKEIYEGDIILDGFDAIHAVEYIGNGFWLQNSRGDNFMPSEPNREVIGNIYENPDLLNNEQKAQE